MLPNLRSFVMTKCRPHKDIDLNEKQIGFSGKLMYLISILIVVGILQYKWLYKNYSSKDCHVRRGGLFFL